MLGPPYYVQNNVNVIPVTNFFASQGNKHSYICAGWNYIIYLNTALHEKSYCSICLFVCAFDGFAVLNVFFSPEGSTRL